MLKGYKTYITAFIAIVGAIGTWLIGEMAMVDMCQIVVPAVIGACVRAGVANQ
jgi:hypothetical protein